jgi:hypothetical protein
VAVVAAGWVAEGPAAMARLRRRRLPRALRSRT